MTKVFNGFAVGDWITVSMDVEGSPHVGGYAGESGCITDISEKNVNPFVVKFNDGMEWSFSADELKLDESYLKPYVDAVDRVIDALAAATGIDPREDYCQVDTYENPSREMVNLFFEDAVDTRTVTAIGDDFWGREAEPLADWEKGLLEGGGSDAVNHPSHYAEGWSNGAEVIDITENLIGNRANVVKYVARAGKKGGPEKELEDLRKAAWYINREIKRLGNDIDA